MIIATDLTSLSHPIALTVGNFDGVHLGHQHLLRELRQRGTSVVVTFRNHPAEVLRPGSSPSLLCTLGQKLELLDRYGVEAVVLLDFTPEFAAQSPEAFLEELRRRIPFDELLLGYDGRIGSGRSGTPERLQAIAEKLGFALDYLPALTLDEQPISSGRVREAVRRGDLSQAERCLGRPFSYYARVHAGAGMGRHIGYPTANLDIDELCAPPLGVYAVTLRHGERLFAGVANYGLAPTVHVHRKPLFEAHLFSFSGELYEATVELTLLAFLRPERHFSSVEELKAQIARDIEQAQAIAGCPGRAAGRCG